MALLRMLYRAAFICNICFLLAIVILRLRHPVNPGLTSLVLVMGLFVSVILNIIINLWMLMLFFNKRRETGIPRLLVYLNGGFLAIQLILFLK